MFHRKCTIEIINVIITASTADLTLSYYSFLIKMKNEPIKQMIKTILCFAMFHKELTVKIMFHL